MDNNLQWSNTQHRLTSPFATSKVEMSQLQLPFTLSSHPAIASVEHDSDQRGPTSAPPSFSTCPVLRLSDCQRASKQSLQVIVTVPGQGWSIHKVSDQTILSSQKVSPSLVFTSPSVALSIPKIEPAEQQAQQLAKSSTRKIKKTRTRYVYAAVASCPSDPSSAVNQGRTIWVWVENEVNGGFGERDALNQEPAKSSSANIIKEFPSRVEMVYPLPPTDPKDGSATQLARILVLLQSGEALLCNEELTTIATCRVHSNPPTSIPAEFPHVRIQTHNKNDQSNITSNLISHPAISMTNSPGLLIYISRLKPEFASSSDQMPNGLTPKSRSKKRKSVPTQPSKPTSGGLTHYSQLEICVLELQSDKVHTLGHTCHKEDFLDLAIGAHGWVTIMARSHVLSTHLLSHPLSSAPDEEQLPSRDLTLIPHPQCSAIQLTTGSQSVDAASTSTSSTPVLVPLPCPIPLVLVLMSNSTQPSTGSSPICLGLVLDLYHQAVLFVLQCPWPIAPKHSQSSPSDHGPATVSATLSSLPQPPQVYLCLSYSSIRIVQVLQAPEFPQDGPTWVDVLNPAVTDATLAWITPEPNTRNAQVQTAMRDPNELLLTESLLDSHTMCFRSEARTEEIPHLQSFKSFISRFNEICRGVTSKTERWDAETAKAAEVAWVECILTPLSSTGGADTQDVNMEGADSSDQIVDRLAAAFIQEPDSASKLGSVLSKELVQVLLKICLGQFAAELSKDLTSTLADNSTYSTGSKANTLKPYPAQIVICLLNSGLVEQSMVPGGVVAALRRTGDVAGVEVAITKLFDVDESESVETIRWAMQFQNSHPPTPCFKEGTDHKQSLLRRLLSKIVSQPLSTGPLKKALKQILSTHEIIVIFRILNEWIDWWMEDGMDVLRINHKSSQTITSLSPIPKSTDESSGSINADPPSKNASEHGRDQGVNPSGLPGLRRIFEFIECSLDAHLIGLIQFKEANQILKSLKLKLKREIEIDTVLQGLNGPLAHSAKLIKQKQRRQREALEKSTQRISTTHQKTQPGNTTTTPRKPFRPDSANRTVQHNGRAASKPTNTKNKKRPVHPDVRRLQGETGNAQSVAEYTLERFNL
ncbi:hypothetical protein MJO28_011887 [Puccinia striiformis f. sp. tritici]|uniref:Uncharacterized protein n=1 Tax=Puccinia striiformis f. sp. tritici TaxID=168172 RepID=A0ACC0E5F0_9BASI|nr:hypothetical protein MJO28_011887 [Puccinia striiformis f. sp. tritici]KAI7947118.1 hypothetical protein MJO29_011645 [Puccinia striiformis f. sp. tritici]